MVNGTPRQSLGSVVARYSLSYLERAKVGFPLDDDSGADHIGAIDSTPSGTVSLELAFLDDAVPIVSR